MNAKSLFRSIALCLGILCCTIATAQFTFVETTYAVPNIGGGARTNGSTIRSADFNHDGWADIAMVGYRKMMVMLATGNGAFAPVDIYYITPNPATDNATNLAFGDFDEDGHIDIVVSPGDAYFYSIGAIIFYGTGSGTFNPAAALPSPHIGSDLVQVADLNNDGHDDVLSAYWPNRYVHLGTGTGTFNSSYTPGLPFHTFIFFKDVNNDGFLDFASGYGPTRINLGDGTGNFSTAFTFPSDPGSNAILEDMDGDNIVDLVAQQQYVIVIFKGNGDGTFQTAPFASLVPTNNITTHDVKVVDINNDGNRDVLVTHSRSAGTNRTFILAYLGDGIGGFGTETFLAASQPSSLDDYMQFDVADLNNDGRLDFSIKGQNDEVWVLLNTTPPTPSIASFTPISGPIGTMVTITGTNFDTTPANNIVMFNGTAATVTASTSTSITATVPSGATTGPISVTVGGNTATSATNFTVAPFNISYTAPLSVTVGSTPREVVVGDVDGDGHKDLVVSNFGSGSISFLKGIGNGCFQSALNFNTGPNSHGLALADLNQDSRLDLVVTKGSNITSFTSLSVLFGNGVSFDPQSDYTTAPIPRSPNHVNVGDFNKDGWPDVIVANNNPSGSFSILYNNGNGTFATGVDFPSANGPAFFVATDDVNGDTHPDVAIASYYNNTASIFLNNGLGSFTPETTYPSAAGPHYVVLKDLNGDSRPEMIVANAIANSISVFLNNGTGSFSSPAIYATGNYPTTLSVADMDNDGKLDLVVGNANSGSITALPGDGVGGFGAYQSFSVGGQPYSVATGDFDEDGKLDIVSVDLSSNKVTLLRTLSSSTCLPPTITSFLPDTGPIGTTVTITGTNFDPVAANNTVKFNGVDAETPSTASATSLTVTVPTGATTGPISVTTIAGTGISSTNFTVTCTPPSPPTASSVSRCGDGTVTLTTSGATGTQEYRWYDVASGGTSQSSIATFTTPSLTTTTSFYVSIFDVATSCESSRTQVDAIINTPPASPSPVNNSGCSGTSISLSASGGSSGQYRWYSVATGGTADAAQQNDSFTTPALTTTTSYWVAINDGACESSRTEVIATVIPLPAAPGVQPVSPVCPGSDVTLTATGGTDGQYRWYNNAVLITGEVNSTYLITNLTSTKTFQVAIYDGTCESNKTSATASVQNCTAPIVASTTATAFIEGIVTIDLEELVTDDEDNIDLSRLQITMQPTSGASAELVGFELRINYAGYPFVWEDQVGIEACDMTDLCTDQQLTIELGGEITVYNGFSPNGDGLNEFFKIQYIDILPETQSNQVMIYNRWGDEVFSIRDYNNDDRVFKGDNNGGNKLPTGTYFYKIIFSGGKETVTGFLELKY